jgi:serine/tyrosine/threonine adenylyltransferase
MEAFDIRHICNHSDQQGRYSYQMQPRIGEWNCYALGQALLPLIGDVETTQDTLKIYQPEFQKKLDQLLHAKLGLLTVEANDDKLIDDMFILMQNNHVDFTLFFRRLGDLQTEAPGKDEPLRDLFLDRPAFDAWAVQYRARLKQENTDDARRKAAMHAVNPKYVLRNYLAQVAIDKAQKKDFSEIEKLLKVLEKPFDEQPQNERYADLPPDWANQLQVSCSS